MSTKTRAFILWFYIVATIVTFLAIVGITIFEVHIRWAVNQNFSVLDNDALPALMILFAAQMIGLVWLTKEGR